VRRALCMPPDEPVEAVHLAEYFKARDSKEASVVTGFCGYHLRKKIYPWCGAGQTDEVVVRNFQQLRRCVQSLRNIWMRVGLWEKAEEPYPPQWKGSRQPGE